MSVTVVGFDIGNSTSFIAVAKGGGIETIDNEYSDRCTPTYVSFGEKSRFIGASAKQQAITNIKNTFFNFPRFIGKKFSDPSVQKEISLLPIKVVQLGDDKIGFQCKYLNENATYSPEQVMAIQLTKLKEITETHLKTPCIDVVINVPAYYTDSERSAMLDSATIAGLNCVRLVNDTTACGIAYGLYNKDLPDLDKPARIVAFVMIGQSNMQVAICAFNNGKLKVLSTKCDPCLGGRDLDLAIYNYMCKDILTRYKLDVSKNPKAAVRLLQECEKLKKLMSANSTKIPLNIECFMDDKDISCSLQRSEFEELIADELRRVESTMQECIEMANFTSKDIAIVELVGGSTRIPVIKSLVQKVFNQEGRTTLNSDEAVARGCALQAAICSPAFKVKDFAVSDVCHYGVQIRFSDEKEPTCQEIFPKLHPFPSSRMIKIYRRSDFNIDVYYSDPKQLQNNNTIIGKFSVRGVKVPEELKEATKILLKVRMNSHGIFNLSHIQLVEIYQKEVEVDMTPEEIAEMGGTISMEVDSKPESETIVNGEPEKNVSEQKIPKKKEMRNFERFIDLPVDSILFFKMNENELNFFKEKEFEMIQHDRLERDRSNAKNALEEYIYEMRDKISGVLIKYVLEHDREEFFNKLTQMEDWLYNEGEDLPKQPYIDRLTSLKTVGDVYIMRLREAEMRPAAIEKFTRSMNNVEKTISSYHKKEDTFNHLTPDDIKHLEKALLEKRQWCDHKFNIQNSTPLTENPVVYVSEIEIECQNFLNATNPIIQKKKPVIQPPPAPDNSATADSNGHSENNTTDAAGENNNPVPNANNPKQKHENLNTAADCMDLD